MALTLCFVSFGWTFLKPFPLCAKLGNLVKLLHVYCVPDTAVVSVISSQPLQESQ